MDRLERGRALMKKIRAEKIKNELRERAKKRLEADKKKKEAEKKKKEAEKKKKQNTTAKPQPKKKKLKLKPKQKPELFRDSFQQISMTGEYLPPEFRFNTPAYDIASGYYINQGKYNVKCWTRYNKSGNPYTTCYNNDYDQQLRRGQPPHPTKMRTWLGRTGEIQLEQQKNRLKPINREPDLNYTLI